MASVLTEPTAASLVVLDETGGATLSEVSRATGRPLSTIQRAIDGLLDARVLQREAPRGRLRFAANAPRRALRELAEWRLGSIQTRSLIDGSRQAVKIEDSIAPPSIHNPHVRAAWPQVINAIVSTYHPARVILFGSQARGDAGPDSDVDLLVVFSEEIDRRERQAEILSLLRTMPFAKDVLVATTANVTRPLIGSALATAMREGITVYEG